MTPDQDPGWDFWVFIPIVGPRRARKRSSRGVQQVRYLFQAFSGAIVMFGFVLAVISGDEEAMADLGSAGPWIAVVASIGLLTLPVVARVARRALDGSGLEALSKDYSRRFFTCIAIAEPVALGALAGALVTGDPALYFVAAPLTLAAFALAAPTRSHIERDHEDLRRRGSLLSIYEALATPAS